MTGKELLDIISKAIPLEDLFDNQKGSIELMYDCDYCNCKYSTCNKNCKQNIKNNILKVDKLDTISKEMALIICRVIYIKVNKTNKTPMTQEVFSRLPIEEIYGILAVAGIFREII